MFNIGRHTKKSVKLFDNIASCAVLFLLMVLIPISSNYFIYGNAKNSFENEVNHEIEKVMNEMMKHIDSVLYFNEYTVSNLQSREELKRLILLSEEEEVGLYAPEIITLQKFLADIKGYNTDYKEFFVVFPDINLALSSTYQDTLDRFFEYYYDEDSISLQDWKASLWRNNYAECKRNTDEEGADVLEFMYQLPLYGNSNIDAMAVMRVDYNLFQSIVSEAYESPDPAFYVYDRFGSEIFWSAGAEQYPSPVIRDGLLVNASDFKVNSSIRTSPNNSFVYLGIFPDAVYQEKMKYVNLLNIVNLIFSISVSALLFYYILKKYFLRIKKTLSKFKDAVNGHSYQNDVDMIKDVFKDYISVRRKYDNLKENTAYHSFLEMLFKNSSSYTSIISDYSIDFEYDSFCVGCFKVLDIEKMSDETDFYYIYTVIQNVFEEVINTEYCCYVTFLEGKIMVLFNIDQAQTEQFRDFLSENTRKANEIIKNNFDFEFSLYISDFYAGVESIADAYNEVCNLIRYKSGGKNESPLICAVPNSGLGGMERELAHDFFEKSKTLVKLIKYGDYKSAKAVLNTIVEKYITRTNFEIAQIFIFDLEGEILKIIHNLDSAQADVYYKELSNLINFQSSAEFFETLSSLIEKLCKEIKACEEDKKIKEERAGTDKQELLAKQDAEVREMIFNIIEYINCNYSDNNLNITAIGDRFNVAPYYISNKFKKVMNISMVDYINKVRIEKAKEIMEQTDQPVSQTAESVGFNNIRTFMRVFMKYESITPGKYKNINKK